MTEIKQNQFAAEVILNSFAIAQEFYNTLEIIKGEALALRLLVIADIFSILLDTLKRLRFTEDFQAVQINYSEVLSLADPQQPKVVPLEEFKRTGVKYLSFADIEPLGFKPHLNGLQPTI